MEQDDYSVIITLITQIFPTASAIVILAEPDVHIIGNYGTEEENVNIILEMLNKYKERL
jgi:hypothetical protein